MDFERTWLGLSLLAAGFGSFTLYGEGSHNIEPAFSALS
jgi:hypothetical protein